LLRCGDYSGHCHPRSLADRQPDPGPMLGLYWQGNDTSLFPGMARRYKAAPPSTDIRSDPPRLVLGHEIGRSAPAPLFF